MVAAQGFDEVQDAAVDEFQRGVVDHDLHAVGLEGLVVVLDGVVEVEAVGEAGAAAAVDDDAQHQPVPGLGLEQSRQLRDRAFAEADAFRRGVGLQYGRVAHVCHFTFKISGI